MPLPSVGIFLNAYPVACNGAHTFTRFPVEGADVTRMRRDAERHIGRPVQIFDSAAWVAGNVQGGEVVAIDCHTKPQLHQFLLRNALQRQAASRGFETWFGLGGELHCVPLQSAQEIGPILVEPVLKSRFSHEGAMGHLVILVIRWQVRWRFRSDLGDPDLARWAVGETALKLTGDGPRNGRIVGVRGNTLDLLLRGGNHREAPASSYALVARPPLVQRYLRYHLGGRSQEVYRALQIASGTLERSGRRNRYQVKEREQRALDLLLRIGGTLDLDEGAAATIADVPVEVRV